MTAPERPPRRAPRLPIAIGLLAALSIVTLLSCGGKGDAAGTADPATSSTASSAAAAGATITVDTAGWSAWTKQVKPIYSGPYSLIGDPSVLRDGNLYRMYYTCYDAFRSPQGPAICQATSTDGLAWTDVPVTVNPKVTGQMVAVRPGKWDTAHETAFALKFNGEYLLYFVGYQDKGGFFNSFPASLGLAVSRDGLNFQRYSDGPVLSPTPGGYDNDAVFSPSIVEHEGQLVMLYTGHCWNNCPKGTGLYILAATSPDGRVWTKRDGVIMSKADLPGTKDGAAEADLVKGPDGLFYLFTSLMQGDSGHDIGIARAPTPFGPWEINPDPIVRRSAGQFDEVGPIAPSVLIEDNRVRMWFHGFSKSNQIQIGYAESPWPLRPAR